ncbi:hypothetical protein ACH4C2_15300 [Streptomyces sp. NPDC018057]|uniref:hypothetical protein n=1 Tax=unclassified Streptomyces TaxID=2593676 RepID=UPI0037912DBB
MAKDDGDTGTYKVTDAKIDEIVTGIGGLLQDMAGDNWIALLKAFGGDKTVDGFDRIYAGSGKGVASTGALQADFARFAAEMTRQLENMSANLHQAAVDLKLVHQYLQDGEDGAAVTAEAMTADLRDVVGLFGGTVPTTTAPVTTTEK